MKRALPLLFALVLTTPFWDLGHPLWEVDDARYAEVPREMHESGNWLTPSLNYVDYVEKPPFIYWLGAVSYGLFGVSEAASRAPLALLSVLGMLGVWWLGSWLYSREVGLYAGILLGTCAEYSALSHLITPDMAISVALLWASGLILRCLRRPEDRWAGALAWLAMAAAFLSKGLIAIVLPGVWTVMLIFFFPHLRKGLRPLLYNWGLPIFLLIIGTWFYAMEAFNPGFFNHFIIEQHFQRFLDTGKYNRPGPWFFFIPVALVGTLPWTPLMVLAALTPLVGWNRSDARDRQLALWIALIFTFFSISSSKLITYILPLFAHQALLGARLLVRLDCDGILRRRVGRFGAALAVLFIFSAVIGPAAVKLLPIPTELPPGLIVAGISLLLCLAASQFLLARAASRGRVIDVMPQRTLLALGVTAMLLIGSRYLVDEFSARNIGTDIDSRISRLEPGTPVKLIAYNHYLHGVPFYTGRPVDVVNWIGELHYAKRFDRFAHRFGNDMTIVNLPVAGHRTYVTLRNRDLEHFKNIAPMEKLRDLTPHGPWSLAEF